MCAREEMFLRRISCSVYCIGHTFGRLKYTGEQLRNLRPNRCLPNQSLINNARSSLVLRFIGKRGSRGGKKVKEKLKNDRYKIPTIISNHDEQNYANPQHKYHVPKTFTKEN